MKNIYLIALMQNLVGLIRQPKYGHLKELHRAIKLCEHALVSADPVVTSLGNYQQVFFSTVLKYCQLLMFYDLLFTDLRHF